MRGRRDARSAEDTWPIRTHPQSYEFATTGDVGEFERLGSRVFGRPIGAGAGRERSTSSPRCRASELLAMIDDPAVEETTCA